MIIGDIISKEIPSLEIQNWLLKYREISKKKKITLKAVSGFYVALTDISLEPFWVEFLQENVNTEIIFPPILQLKLNRAEMAFENEIHEIIKEYSTEFIEFIIDNKIKN